MLGLNNLAWLALLVWVAVPLFALVMGLLLWRRSRTPLGKSFVVAASIAVLLIPLLVSNGVKYYYDAQVREKCAKDGGVRVYETVRLPPEKFNQWGQPNFYRPDQGENALGKEYLFKNRTPDFDSWKGNPTVFRYHYEVIRRSDNKLLGETTSYGRGGGDLPGPWYGSKFHCPDHDESSEIAMLMHIFISSEGSEK